MHQGTFQNLSNLEETCLLKFFNPVPADYLAATTPHISITQESNDCIVYEEDYVTLAKSLKSTSFFRSEKSSTKIINTKTFLRSCNLNRKQISRRQFQEVLPICLAIQINSYTFYKNDKNTTSINICTNFYGFLQSIMSK